MTETTRPSTTRRALLALALGITLVAPAMPVHAHPVAAPASALDWAGEGRMIEVQERRGRGNGARQNDRRGAERSTSRRSRESVRRGRGYGKRHRGYCRPYRAIRKAWRMGVDAPRIHRVGRRGVVVAGYRGRHYVRVRFAHGRRCPVMRVRRY